MKQINTYIIIIGAILAISCTKQEKNHSTFSGKIENGSGKFTIKNPIYSKEITINEDGTFKDTLHLKPQDSIIDYTLNIFELKTTFSEPTYFYLKRGEDLVLNAKKDNFGISLSYSGENPENSNYILEKFRLSRTKMSKITDLFQLKEPEFTQKVDVLKASLDSLIDAHSGISNEIAEGEKKSNIELYDNIRMYYNKQNGIVSEKTKEGNPSPKFSNYENYNGGTTSLDDLKGKYVYIDVWATWCGPCIKEIPSLQKLEKEFHGKNIEFVSISIDQPGMKDKWKKMIADKNMGGIQLFAGEDKQFAKDYEIMGIPRFILLDTEGNIVNSNAPRPSDPSLSTVFKDLGI